MDEQGFYISVNPSASLSLYPNNSLASFTNELHSPIDFGNEQWVVGLAEVLVNTGIVNIGEDDARFSVKRLVRPTGDYHNEDEEFVWYETYHLNIPAIHYMTTSALIEAINTQLKSNPKTSDLSLSISRPRRNKDPRNKDPDITLPTSGSDDESIRQSPIKISNMFTFTTHVASLLGFPNKVSMTLDEINSTAKEMIISGMIPKFACIYMDIVTPQYFGDSMTRLLRTVLLKPQHKYRLVDSINYDQIHYVRVENNFISTIKTDIRTLDGVYYPFIPGSLTLKLHLKRIV